MRLNHSGEMEADDRALVTAFLDSRNEDAFGALYRRHSPILYGLAHRLTGAVDAADVVQETWIRAIGALPSFAWASSLRTWLCSIAVNCCRERWRRQGGHRDHELVMPPPIWPSEYAIDVETALARLAPGYRAVVVLHDIYGFTHAEIASQLGIDAGTSKSQLSRARQALRALLDPRSKEVPNVR
jgi:RNA polymerase sigma-70 factor (ECF subfamily)